MKKLILCLLIPSFLYAECRDVVTLISPRSQSVNASREMAGWENYINVHSEGKTYGAFAFIPQVSVSFRPERIAQCFFGDGIIPCKNKLSIKGSQVKDRPKTAWLADYFGLPTDYESTVLFDPKISNAIFDLDLFVGLDAYIPGAYFRIHAPLVYARWDLGFCETLITTGSHAHDPGYFNPDGIPRIQLVDTFRSFISGEQAPKATDLIFNKLQHAKMDCGALRLTKLSDIQIVLGYNILANKKYHLGGNVRFSIPTGNSYNGEYLFQPIIGNGGHWEVGGGVSTHIILWHDEDLDDYGGLYFDANITHLFNAWQCRSFDLCNKPNSRYTLAQLMTPFIEDSLHGVVDGVPIEPNAQYAQEVTSVVNLTTLPVRVSNTVQVDISLMLSYTKGKNSWTIGYGFWGRSCDKICLPLITAFDTQSWALKGDTYVFGFEETTQTPVALSVTESMATINAGTNFPKTGAVTAQEISFGQTNPHIDNPFFAIADANDDATFENLVSQPGGVNRINTSIQPILLASDDINCASAQTRGFSNKMFSSFNHSIELQSVIPYIGFGGEMEFGQDVKCATQPQKGCINTAVSFWSVWLKTGVSF